MENNGMRRDLVATLQALYDSEINVTITTLWDDGYDVALAWSLENVGNAAKVERADQIADTLHRLALEQYPESKYAREARQ